MDTEDEIVRFYVRKLDDDIRNHFPELSSQEMDDFLQDQKDAFLEKVSEMDTAHSDIVPEIPECPSHEIIEDMVARLMKLSSWVDDAQYMRRCIFEGDNTDLAKELQNELMKASERYVKDSKMMALSSLSQSIMDSMIQQLTTVSAMEGESRGLLWGLSPASFTGSECNLISRYSPVFSNNRKVRKFTDMLGRKDDPSKDKGLFSGFNGDSKDHNLGIDIIGLDLGREMANILPSELMLVTDDDLSTIFDIRFVEGRLMKFRREDNVSAERNENGDMDANGQLGPIIMIVDTSGSMDGKPLFYSKALCFTIATRAASQKRDIYRIDFNEGTRCVDMTPRNHFHELLKFLSTSANGGTDPGPALMEAVSIVDEKRYMFADIVVFSDFILDMYKFDYDNPVIERLRKRGCRIHSVMIPCQNGHFDDRFDSCWGVRAYGRKMGANMFDEIKDDGKYWRYRSIR